MTSRIFNQPSLALIDYSVCQNLSNLYQCSNPDKQDEYLGALPEYFRTKIHGYTSKLAKKRLKEGLKEALISDDRSQLQQATEQVALKVFNSLTIRSGTSKGTSHVTHDIPSLLEKASDILLDRSLSDWEKKDMRFEKRSLAAIKIREFLSNSSQDTLDLSGLSLRTLPNIFSHNTFIRLKELSLFNNELTELPLTVYNLPSLRKLVLSSNELTQLPPEISKLFGLDILELNHNQLIKLPPELGKLLALQVLKIDNNKLTELPPEMGNLSSLQTLIVPHNQLIKLPPGFGKLSALQILELNDNKLIELSSEVGNLSSLQTLSVYNNKLTKLPRDVGGLSGLRKLFLNGNELSTLPSEIGNLSGLKDLSLFGNPLTALPNEILTLSQSCEINVSFSRISPGLLEWLEKETKNPDYRGPKITIYK